MTKLKIKRIINMAIFSSLIVQFSIAYFNYINSGNQLMVFFMSLAASAACVSIGGGLTKMVGFPLTSNDSIIFSIVTTLTSSVVVFGLFISHSIGAKENSLACNSFLSNPEAYEFAKNCVTDQGGLSNALEIAATAPISIAGLTVVQTLFVWGIFIFFLEASITRLLR